jgi:phage shock protein PspC (stress-responsive transcriptional regulator)
MNEITQIHLGRQPFTIAVDAHKQLRTYMDAISEAVGAAHKEVLTEIELRMAELLIERGITAQKTILVEDVTYLKEQLGKPGDFKGDAEEGEESEHEGSDKEGQKRLFRDEKKGMIAGVCAGLASYFNIDAVIVRGIFILLTVMWGWGALLYIILWAIVPAAKTSAERLQMRGKAVTVENLNKIVTREVTAAADRASKASGQVAQLFEGFFRVSAIVIGAGIVAVSAILLGILSAATGYVARYHDGLIQELVSFPDNGTEVFLLIALAVAAATSLFMLLATGLALIKRKWTIRGWVTGTVAAVFVAAMIGASIVAPNVASQVHNRYERAHKTASRTLQPFEAIDLRGAASLDYVESDKYKVTVRYFSKVEPSKLTTRVDAEKTLVLDTRELEKTGCDAFCIDVDRTPQVTIYAPNAEKLRMAPTEIQ